MRGLRWEQLHLDEVLLGVGPVLVEVVDLEGHADAGAVDHGVEAAELLLGLPEGRGHVLRLGHVHRAEDRVRRVDGGDDGRALQGYGSRFCLQRQFQEKA